MVSEFKPQRDIVRKDTYKSNKEFDEHLIQFRVSVQRKHFEQAQREVFEVIQKYKSPVVHEWNYIIESVVKYTGVDELNLRSKKRDKDIIFARHLARYFLRHKTNLTLNFIGDYFNQDHTTVLVSVRKIKDWIKLKDEKTLLAVEGIKTLLNS